MPGAGLKVREEAMHSNNILVHVGYFKTGSTWLQREVFDNDALGLRVTIPMREILDDLVIGNPFAFEPGRIRQKYLSFASTGPGLVLSHERLSGAPISGGVDANEILNRLHAVLPDARILIVIRRQPDVILSSYAQYVRSGGAASLKAFMSLSDRHLGEVPVYNTRFHAYHWLVRAYLERFGEGQVLVLPFELMRENQEKFVNRILSFAGLPNKSFEFRESQNESIGFLSLSVQRRLNLLFSRNSTNIAAPFYFRGANRIIAGCTRGLSTVTPQNFDRAAKIRSQRYIKEAVDGLYAASNREVMQLTGLDLGAYGYDV